MSEDKKYPLLQSAIDQSLIPYFAGLDGIYCLNEQRRL